MYSVAALGASQNADGGWPYRRGSSCTEPTVFALLGCIAAGEARSAAAQKGARWLQRTRRADGGWPPCLNVDQSSWVTALVLLLPPYLLPVNRRAAVQWLLNTSGRETSWVERIRSVLIDGHSHSGDAIGFPWAPDASAWVTPTCFGLLALEKMRRSEGSKEIEARCSEAREYLLSHMCRDGGWNHGSTSALGYDSGSYPETTGQALLALHGMSLDRLPGALQIANSALNQPRSLEATSWLRLGLLAHGKAPPECAPPKGHGGVVEVSLSIIADAAAQGRNVFID